ncbi:MAG: redoxin domain-containing protein [Chromatiales bacterium]|nr:redoxin domain-containing protein [Chromatiales bacterium]
MRGPLRSSLARGLVLLTGLALMTAGCRAETGVVPPAPAPAFTHTAPAQWIGSPPLTLAALRGKVVLLDVWAFECWNCYRSFPWLNAMAARLEPRGLQVIGVHTPEFDREKDRGRLEAKVAEFGLHHPVMIDNDWSYWNALGNRYWPAWYVLDRQGRIRGRFIGETHAGDAQAQRIEALIETLLTEPG